jgi:hypothetical protein
MSICEEDRMSRIIQERTNEVMLNEIRHHVNRLGCTSDSSESSNYLAIDRYEDDERGRPCCLISCWTKSITCELQHLFWIIRYLKRDNLCIVETDEYGQNLRVVIKADNDADDDYPVTDDEAEMELPMLWHTLFENLLWQMLSEHL